MAFFEELKRRKVFRVGVAYVIVAWIIIQVADTLFPTFGAPTWVMPVFTTITMLGFPLALVLAWAFEITPIGVRLTVDEETHKGSPSGLILNVIIMGVMAVAIMWLVIDRSLNRTPAVESDMAATVTVAPVSADRLPNSIAVLPFANLSPDENNAYFAAGIHDTVLLELSKIRDMNVIARTSVLPYADTNLPLDDIAETLKVQTIMEGSVQYAEGQVRITAQLINPDTGAHLWSGNYDRPFADVFTIQSEIAQNIASAIGAELLPEELRQITRQQTASEEAYALYLQAKALTPNIAPFMAPQALDYLQQAILLDPAFAEPYAVLAFHYALTVGFPVRGMDMNQREAVTREYAQTALRLNPNLGLAYGALAMIENAYFREAEGAEYWNRALELSPNDSDVLDDAIRVFAQSGDMIRANELANRLQQINPNPNALLTAQIWLAYGTGNVTPFLDYMNARSEAEIDPLAVTFFTLVQSIFEISRNNQGIAADLLDRIEADPPTPDLFNYPYLPWANGLIDRVDHARQQFDAYVTYHGGALPVNVESVMMLLGIHDETGALDMLQQVARKDGFKGNPTTYYVVAKNFHKHPVLEQPEFVAARRQLGIPLE